MVPSTAPINNRPAAADSNHSPPPLLSPFQTSIGPRGDLTGYLRPETAQVGNLNLSVHFLFEFAIPVP